MSMPDLYEVSDPAVRAGVRSAVTIRRFRPRVQPVTRGDISSVAVSLKTCWW